MDFTTKLNRFRSLTEAALDARLPAAATRPARLHEAMRYSLQAGGKRLRPALVLAAAELFPGSGDALPAAAAVECLHTYTLIHDDLPAMDNDDLRRGLPTCHKRFDEATAILAGDALQALAFEILARDYAASPALAAALVAELARAAGSRELVGGQAEDLAAENAASPSAADLEYIHRSKTAALIRASLVMGGRVGGAGTAALEALAAFGEHLGLAFQITDDILDATGDAAALGKTPGKDAATGKLTYVRLHGLAGAREAAAHHGAEALAALTTLPGDTAFLAELVRQLEARRA